MTDLNPNRALILFSGGQDSATCLAWALDRYESVETVGFAYGQRHAVELEARGRVRDAFAERFPAWRARLGPDHLLDLAALGEISDTAMTRDTEIRIAENGLPTTFVPGRNLIFLTFAAALAYRRDCGAVAGGMCETDYSGYPDCRAETIAAMARALNLGMASDIAIETPLMRLDKAQSWVLAEELGGAELVELIVEESHSCYTGDRSQRHDWGYGCGACPACELRAKGWEAYAAGERSSVP